MDHASPSFTVPPAKQAAVKALMKVPLLPTHVMACLAILIVGVVTVDVLAIRGHLSLGWAAVLNTLFMYFNFTTSHDAIHRSASSHRRLNDALGWIGLLMTTPQVHLGLFRWAHVQHHKHTNDPAKDPDLWLHGPLWQMPLRFILIDVGYLLFVLRKGDAVARRHLRFTMLTTVPATLVAALGLTWLGYGEEVLFLWFIPSRAALILTGYLFFWLPHVDDSVPASRDLTAASSMRLGHEWLLSPLMLGHNHHLIHHLYPSMPSSRHGRAWRLLEPELRQRQLQVQHGFAIQPVMLKPGEARA